MDKLYGILFEPMLGPIKYIIEDRINSEIWNPIMAETQNNVNYLIIDDIRRQILFEIRNKTIIPIQQELKNQLKIQIIEIFGLKKKTHIANIEFDTVPIS